MKSKTFKPSRSLLIVCIIVLITLATGCQRGRVILPAQELKTLSTGFDSIASAHFEAFTNHSPDQMGKLYTDDIQYYEWSTVSETLGIDRVIERDSAYLTMSPQIEGRRTGTFIGRGEGFDNWEIWGLGPGSHDELYTTDNPAGSYNLYTLQDGKIAEWRQMWASNYVAVHTGKTLTQSILLDYAKAWSSGDPQAVVSLYSPQAVRTDTLFGDTEKGSDAIKQFAGTFFAWYPGVRLVVTNTFQLSSLENGAVYAIHVTDQASKPCVVNAIILLDSAFNTTTGEFDKISNERVFYQPNTLLACGWAR